MDYAAFKAFKPSEFEDAGDGYHAMGNMAQAAKEHVENSVAAGMRKTLEGEAAEASQKQLQALAKNFHYIHIECGVTSTALNGFAYDMAAAQRKLNAAIGDAQADGCTVNADGSVAFPRAEAGRREGRCWRHGDGECRRQPDFRCPGAPGGEHQPEPELRQGDAVREPDRRRAQRSHGRGHEVGAEDSGPQGR
ncbi:hypothetical protein NKH18_35465 [Streptomyces sp. M10(2022)]